MRIEQWFSAGTDEPRDKQRDIDVPRGPEADAGYWAVIGPNGDGWGWTVVDGIDGTDVADGMVPDEAAARQAVARWEAAYLYADEVMRQIDADIKAGTVPASVRSFTELHDHVDANGYLTVVPDLPDGTFDTDTINLVTTEVTNRLANRS